LLLYIGSAKKLHKDYNLDIYHYFWITKVQGIMKKATRKRASTPVYVSPKQLTIDAFESPFSQQLKSYNRWVVLANLNPWDEICGTYLKHVGTSSTGRPPLSPRVVLVL